jgi:hypothetical protein
VTAKLFTAFVSSTYLDLVPQRLLVAQTLREHRCVPLGMELFPSTGAAQWSFIEESLAESDFAVFIIAGRYGSIDLDSGLSWTRREFREAAQLGIPIVVLVHSEPDALPVALSEIDPGRRRALEEFRREVEGVHVQYYTNDTELASSLARSVAALQRDRLIEGWVRGGRDPIVLQRDDYDREYELLHTVWEYRPPLNVGSDGVAAWDALYCTTRRVRANHEEGLGGLALEYTRESPTFLPYEEGAAPELTLRFVRERHRRVTLAPRPRRFGGSYVRDITFDPPLARNEVAEFTVSGSFPRQKYAFFEDLVDATIDARSGPRRRDWSSRSVSFPTRRLRMEVFLHDALGAAPTRPIVSRGADEDVRATQQLSEFYELVTEDGGVRMVLDVPEPLVQRTYRLEWALPSRSTS